MLRSPLYTRQKRKTIRPRQLQSESLAASAMEEAPLYLPSRFGPPIPFVAFQLLQECAAMHLLGCDLEDVATPTFIASHGQTSNRHLLCSGGEERGGGEASLP